MEREIEEERAARLRAITLEDEEPVKAEAMDVDGSRMKAGPSAPVAPPAPIAAPKLIAPQQQQQVQHQEALKAIEKNKGCVVALSKCLRGEQRLTVVFTGRKGF